MRYGHSVFQKVRYFSSVSTIYALTLLFAWYAIHPALTLDHTRPVALTRVEQTPHTPVVPAKVVIAGIPVRIVIPASGVDLPIDEGYYDSSTGGWTLSGYRAQFAMISTEANDTAGDTFIYGHNNDYVFGALRHNTPAAGAQALIYTSNGHIFSYTFQSTFSLAPNDTSVLTYQGAPILTIQTCTGSINEWRTMYRFNFDKVVQ